MKPGASASGGARRRFGGAAEPLCQGQGSETGRSGAPTPAGRGCGGRSAGWVRDQRQPDFIVRVRSSPWESVRIGVRGAPTAVAPYRRASLLYRLAPVLGEGAAPTARGNGHQPDQVVSSNSAARAHRSAVRRVRRGPDAISVHSLQTGPGSPGAVLPASPLRPGPGTRPCTVTALVEPVSRGTGGHSRSDWLPVWIHRRRRV